MIGPRARAATACAFFAYVLLIRTYDIADTFLMLGEQTRDWAIALGGITELPLTGAPSTAGGRGFGPVYYWILWLGRNLVGPFTDFLPHAGGIHRGAAAIDRGYVAAARALAPRRPIRSPWRCVW